MTKLDTLTQEAQTLPNTLLGEALDFIRFLKTKHLEQIESAVLSEQALAKTWLTPEEDEAWQDL